MRVFILLMSFISSVSMAAVEDFNGLVQEASLQEKILHRKLLQAIQNTQVSIAYHDATEQLQKMNGDEGEISVSLVPAKE